MPSVIFSYASILKKLLFSDSLLVMAKTAGQAQGKEINETAGRMLGPRQKINAPSGLSFGPSAALHPPAHIH